MPSIPGVLAAVHCAVLALFLSGCGFSGSLYLPEESPPDPEEQSAPEDSGAQPEAPPN